MQIYINPIELLNLDTNSPNGLDGSSIRKAKKSLLAEIELSDTDNIIYNSIELTKSDCIKAIDDLDHKEILDFAKPYLGKFLSMSTDWTPLKRKASYFSYNKNIINPKDIWQFTTFLVNNCNY